ncbi:plasmid mobilization protein [Klebsiella pneumoniae]
MARQRKNATQKLEPTVAFRVTADELAQLQAKARAARMSRSRYLRLAVLGNTTTIVAAPPRPAKIDDRALKHFNLAFANLNQIARRLNIDHQLDRVDADTYADVRDALSAIETYLHAKEP